MRKVIPYVFYPGKQKSGHACMDQAGRICRFRILRFELKKFVIHC